MSNVRVLISVLRDRRLRWVELGLLAFSASESAAWLAITVFAYARGGVTEAGFVVFGQLIAAAVVVPFVAVAADRVPRNRALAGGFALQAIALVSCGVAMSTGFPTVAIYVLATIASICVTFSRPTASAVIPSLVTTPAELTAANVADNFAQGIGMFIGPAAAGVVLARFAPGAVFVCAGVLMGLVAASTVRLELNERWTEPDELGRPGSWTAELIAGFALLRADRDSRILVELFTLSSVVYGAVDLAFVAVAIDLLGDGNSSAGLLAAAFGVGGVVGAMGAVALVRQRRLTWALIVGAVFTGVPIVAIAATPNLAVVAVLFGLGGLGSSVVDISGRTMLQGLTPDETIGRVFGVVEGLGMAALAVGGLWFSGLVTWLGLEWALVVVGLALPAAVAVRSRRFVKIDASRQEVDPELLRMVRAVAIFAPLPVYTIEQLLVNLVPETYDAGVEVFHQGDDGDRFYLVTKGCAEVCLSPTVSVHCEVGDFFGEIALLQEVPRMATVRSGPDGMTVHALERDVFLSAVTGSTRSLHRLGLTITQRLDEAR